MHKRAPTDFPVHDFIAERWSPRAFSDKSVAPEVLASLFEAARWAPSSSNEQPWAYIVAAKEDAENFAKLVSVLVPGKCELGKKCRGAGFGGGGTDLCKNRKAQSQRAVRCWRSQRVADGGGRIARIVCAPDGRIRGRQGAAGFRDAGRMGTHRGVGYRLSRRSGFAAGTYTRAGARSTDAQAA